MSGLICLSVTWCANVIHSTRLRKNPSPYFLHAFVRIQLSLSVSKQISFDYKIMSIRLLLYNLHTEATEETQNLTKLKFMTQDFNMCPLQMSDIYFDVYSFNLPA